jgi:hypothetical protein
MTDFTARAPVHPERTDELHDQSKMPAAPAASRPDLARRFAIVGLGIMFAVGFTAMGVDIIDSWDARRDPRVPGAATIAAIGGIGAAYLAVRGRWMDFTYGALVVVVTGVIMFFNYLRGAYTDGSDLMRDFFAVSAGILFTVAMIYFTVMWLWIEFKGKDGTVEAAEAE